jgi:hypothetical protein
LNFGIFYFSSEKKIVEKEGLFGRHGFLKNEEVPIYVRITMGSLGEEFSSQLSIKKK